MSISPVVFLNGRYLQIRKAKIPAMDRGFLLGDAVFETLHISRGQPVFWKEHTDRLFRSLKVLGISLSYSKTSLLKCVIGLLKKNHLQNASLRITISRGLYQGDLFGDHKTKPTLLMFLKPFSGFPKNFYNQGVSVALTSFASSNSILGGNSIKSTNYLPHILARKSTPHAYESVLLSGDGYLAECTTSNLFFVDKDEIKTPSMDCGILAGITRKTTIQIIQSLHLRLKEGKYKPACLQKAKEAFLTSSLRGIMPIASVNGKNIGNGKPGPVTRRLMEQYAKQKDAA